MSIKIEKKITKYAVQKPEETQAAAAKAEVQAENKAAALALSSKPVEKIVTERAEKKHKAEVIRMHEALERPDMLIGSTYKVKTPVSDHAMYITINDIILNEGTPYEQRRPFEIFINSKNLDHFQWIVALKGGDVAFLVEELKAVFDPRGGYWKPGGKFMPSLIAEIGDVIEKHLMSIGMMHKEGLDEHQKKLIAQKRAEFEAAAKQTDAFAESQFPAGAQLCQKCSTAAVVMMDGCMTCLNCGDSKCG